MSEQISFIFNGRLTSEHRMDFYESARFQYAASRLLVKLDNFRRNGKFPKKISYKNTPDILILPTVSGSYGLEVIAPALATLGPLLVEAPLSAMLSYVIDRIFKPAGDDNIREALVTHRELIRTFDTTIIGRDATIDRTLDMLQKRMERDDELNSTIRGLYERLIADKDRKSELLEYRDQFRKINDDQEADLITMAAPLLKEMNVPLRRSARNVRIITSHNYKRREILRADKNMADAVDLAIVDRNQTRIDINIIQFNKQSGWGKFENTEWDGTPSFSIPGDILEDIKQTVVNAMNEDLVEVDCFFVRSASGNPQRIIVTDVREIDEY